MQYCKTVSKMGKEIKRLSAVWRSLRTDCFFLGHAPLENFITLDTLFSHV